MLDKLAPPAEETARETTETWIEAFGAAVTRGDECALSGAFVEDGHWRNLFGLSWQFATFSGNDMLARELLRVRARGRRRGFSASKPRSRRATAIGHGRTRGDRSDLCRSTPPTVRAMARCGCCPAADRVARAWTISTSLDFDCDLCGAPTTRTRRRSMRDFAAPDWIEQRQASVNLRRPRSRRAHCRRRSCRHLGCRRIEADRAVRAGRRPRGAHRRQLAAALPRTEAAQQDAGQSPALSAVPVTFPDYIPKDQIANWLESYVDIMDIDFWTRTAFDGANYDDASERWTARLDTRRRAAHAAAQAHRARHLRQRHAEHPAYRRHRELQGPGAALEPLPRRASEWAGRSVVVFGTGTSAHDICQELHAAGADVTMVQRSPTMVVNVEPAQLYDKTYLGDGPPIESATSSIPACRFR